MTRLLLLLALILVLWFLVESRLRALRRRFEAAHRERSAARRPPGSTAPTELLVRCDRCGTYIPQSRARLADGGAWCQPSCHGPAATSG